MLVRRVGAGRVVTIGMGSVGAVDIHDTLGPYLRRLLRNDFPDTPVADLGVKANRFSLAWPRLMGSGRDRWNQKGADFYHRVIERTLELGMEPWVTVHHWDLPLGLWNEGNSRFLEWYDPQLFRTLVRWTPDAVRMTLLPLTVDDW